MPRKTIKKCCICGKPVFSIRSIYCRTCSHFSARMSDERFPLRPVMISGNMSASMAIPVTTPDWTALMSLIKAVLIFWNLIIWCPEIPGRSSLPVPGSMK